MAFGWPTKSEGNQGEQTTPQLKSNPIVNPFPSPGLPRTGKYVIKQRRGFLGTIWLLIKITFALAVGFAACYALFHFDILGVPEPPVLTEERKTISVKELESVVEPASDLVTMRYCYGEADIIKSAKELLGAEIPWTQDVEIIRYSGTVGIGIDISEVSFDIQEPESEEEKGRIVATLPKLTIVQNEIDMDSFEVETVQQTVFNPQNLDNATQLLAKLKKRAKKRVLSDDQFLEDARVNTETVLRNFLTGANIEAYYDIEFAWEQES